MSPPNRLHRRSVILLAVASAIVTANAYYVHPIIGRVADSFGVSAALVGAVPALNQIGLALGVLLLLPLGDRIDNRRLTVICLAAQVASLAVMAVVGEFWVFVAASTVLGFFTITPYLLPAYASKRVAPEQLGFVTAVLTTGVVAGVLLSRTASGVVGEYLGWRTVYVIAALLMAAATIIVPLLMDGEAEDPARDRPSYAKLMSSLGALALSNRTVMMSGAIQGLSFAVFLAVWMGIGLHLVSDEIGLGADFAGYLAAFTALNLLTTPRLGKWADAVGAERARFLVALLQLTGVVALSTAANDWRMLLIPIAMMSISGPMIDITGRMTGLSQSADIRTRLMTLYVVCMFVGGGFGSWAGTVAYDWGGWFGTVALAASLSFCVVALSFFESQRADRRPPRET